MSLQVLITAIVNKPPKNKERDEAFIKEALADWADWLIAFVLPPQRRQGGGEISDAWSPAGRAIRSNTHHSNPPLTELISQEFQGRSWAVTVHLVICDLPSHYRICLFGAAMGYSQASIANALEIKQQRVSDVMTVARAHLLHGLRQRDHTRLSQYNARKPQ